MSYAKERLRSALEIGRLISNAYYVEDLLRIARSLHRLDEQSCNGYADTDWGRRAEARAAKREERLEKKAEDILKAFNLFFYRQGDPRGWPFYILTPEIHAKGEGYYSQGVGVCPF